MEVKLRVIEGTNAGQEILLPVKKFFIGRAEECHLRPQSDLISRDHCAIIAEDAQVWIRDFGSKNGTFVNGERVRGEQPLKNGDRLKVGPLEFEIVLSTSVGGAKRPPVRDLREAVARVAQSVPGGSLPVDQWLGDTSPAAPGGAEAQGSRDTGHLVSGDTGRFSDTSGGMSAAAPLPAVSSATMPISASSTDTVALRAPVAPPAPVVAAPATPMVAAAPAPPTPLPTPPTVPVSQTPAAPAVPPANEEPKSASGSIYSRMAGAPATPAAQVPAPSASQKLRQAPSVYVPPPPDAKVDEDPASDKDAVPPPHSGKMPKSSPMANSRDAAADTLRRLFGRR